jgi:hypothetical protein
MSFSPLRLNTNTTFPNVLPGDFAGQENPYLMSPELSGQFMGFDYGDEKEEEKDNDEPKEKSTTFQDFLMRYYQDAQDEKKYYRSDEYLDGQYERADKLAAAQMARAQEYGKESAMYGYLYQGLPSQIAQAAFSKFAFAKEAQESVREAYDKLNSMGAIREPQYMQLNA